RIAMARPFPWPAPVTRATWPTRSRATSRLGFSDIVPPASLPVPSDVQDLLHLPVALTDLLLGPLLERDVVPVLGQPLLRRRLPVRVLAHRVVVGGERAQELAADRRAARDQRRVLLDVVGRAQPAIVVAVVHHLADPVREVRRDAVPDGGAPDQSR